MWKQTPVCLSHCQSGSSSCNRMCSSLCVLSRMKQKKKNMLCFSYVSRMSQAKHRLMRLWLARPFPQDWEVSPRARVTVQSQLAREVNTEKDTSAHYLFSKKTERFFLMAPSFTGSHWAKPCLQFTFSMGKGRNQGVITMIGLHFATLNWIKILFPSTKERWLLLR